MSRIKEYLIRLYEILLITDARICYRPSHYENKQARHLFVCTAIHAPFSLKMTYLHNVKLTILFQKFKPIDQAKTCQLQDRKNFDLENIKQK